MGSRFLITGIQLGMIKAEIKIIASALGADDKITEVMKTLDEVHDKQYIGESENMIDGDTNDIRNLWASWCGKAATDTENEIYDSYFTLYWLDGKREVVKGTKISDAMTHAGYGQGAMKALDFYAQGVDYDYKWNSTTHTWDRKEQ